VKDYLSLWVKELLGTEKLLERESVRLGGPVRVIGEREEHSVSESEFAKVQLTLYPSSGFEVEDIVAERDEVEGLGVGWPDPAIFGLLDVLMLGDSGPLYRVRVVLEKVWYHKVDSSQNAFRHAGRDAGRKVIQTMRESNGHDPGYEMT
jgi:hypothetical protein